MIIKAFLRFDPLYAVGTMSGSEKFWYVIYQKCIIGFEVSELLDCKFIDKSNPV